MNFYQDKQIKIYCLFLGVFFIFTFVIGIFLGERQTYEIKRMYLAHDEAVASYLLEQGVSEYVVASALNSTSVNEGTTSLLNRVGMNDKTEIDGIPFLSQLHKRSIRIIIVTALLAAAIFFSVTFLFFESRKRLYLYADQVIDGYINGDFAGHLPQNRDGALDQIFTRIEQLAMALQSQTESEHKTKEFLKSTISDISHQLKTPLAALAMYQEIIEDEPDHVSVVREYSGKIRTSLGRMEQLILSMLKITRLDAGNIVFEKHRYKVSDVISQSLQELTTRAGREGKEILIEGEPEGQIYCDREWTSEAVGNIVKNALDHTGAGDTIRVTWENAPAMLRIRISDDGEGIAPEDIYHIFKRFYRSKASLDTQGIGLGLPLAKSIIEGQGGTICVQSELDEGTTFTLSFLTEL